MSLALRVVDTGPSPARWNAAVSAALLDSVESGEVPATLRFHRYPVSAVIGRFQDLAVEVDLEGCRRHRVALVRRITGGGAVVMGPGVLAWDVVVPGATPFGLARACGAATVAALARLGLAAQRRESGSLEVGGRKISGCAGRLAGRTGLHQATLVLDLAGAAPLRLLRRRTEGGRPTADPTHRVTSLAACLGRVPPLADVQHLLAAAFADALGLRPEAGVLTREELRSADRWLVHLVGRDDFVRGTDDGEWERAA